MNDFKLADVTQEIIELRNEHQSKNIPEVDYYRVLRIIHQQQKWIEKLQISINELNRRIGGSSN